MAFFSRQNYRFLPKVALVVTILGLLFAPAPVLSDDNTGKVCSCSVTCGNGEYKYSLTNQNCDVCSLSTCLVELCPVTGILGGTGKAECVDARLATGIIIAIAVGAVFVVFIIPCCVCFWMGACCFSGRKKSRVTYVQMPSQQYAYAQA